MTTCIALRSSTGYVLATDSLIRGYVNIIGSESYDKSLKLGNFLIGFSGSCNYIDELRPLLLEPDKNIMLQKAVDEMDYSKYEAQALRFALTGDNQPEGDCSELFSIGLRLLWKYCARRLSQMDFMANSTVDYDMALNWLVSSLHGLYEINADGAVACNDSFSMIGSGHKVGLASVMKDTKSSTKEELREILYHCSLNTLVELAESAMNLVAELDPMTGGSIKILSSHY